MDEIAIRSAVAEDRPALYEICRLTGDAGEDASGRYADPDLLGTVWVGPYLVLEPDLAFVAVDGAGVAGYVLGAADTAAFEAACEQRWWPDLRQRYPEPPASGDLTPDEELHKWIHHPPPTPDDVLAQLPGAPPHRPAPPPAGSGCRPPVGRHSARRPPPPRRPRCPSRCGCRQRQGDRLLRAPRLRADRPGPRRVRRLALRFAAVRRQAGRARRASTGRVTPTAVPAGQSGRPSWFAVSACNASPPGNRTWTCVVAPT